MIVPPQQAIDKIIKDYVDADKQVQQAGIDLTVKHVYTFLSYGTIDFDNTNRKLADTMKLEWESGYLHLASGCYKIKLNELINLDDRTIGIFFPRSSLIRNGATIYAGLFDPGYKGHPELLLHVINPSGLEIYKNAKVGQLVLFKNRKRLGEYKGIYKE